MKFYILLILLLNLLFFLNFSLCKHHDDEIIVIVDHHHNYKEKDDIQDEKANRCKSFNSTTNSIINVTKVYNGSNIENGNKNNDDKKNQKKNIKVDEHHINHHNIHHGRDLCGCKFSSYGKECRKRELAYQNSFIEWSNKYNKVYSADEFLIKYEAFKDSCRFVKKHHNENKNSSMELGLTQFSDMTHQEFIKDYTSKIEVAPNETKTDVSCMVIINQTIVMSWNDGEYDNIQVEAIITNIGQTIITSYSFDLNDIVSVWNLDTISSTSIGNSNDGNNTIHTGRYQLPNWVDSIGIGESHTFGYIQRSNFTSPLFSINKECQEYHQSKVNKIIEVATNISRPTSFDWRTKTGVLTKIKNQGRCGSCYSFSALACLESYYFKKYGKQLDLSEQELVDCSDAYGNHGCAGGYMFYSFQYILDNGGISLESDYPYTGLSGTCRNNTKKGSKVGTLLSYTKLPKDSEDALADVVANVGPVACGMDASAREIMYYKRGIYQSKSCNKNKLNHAIVIVGYGSENGLDYWIARNSWSEKWGEAGYFRIQRNNDNNCGIASLPSFPVIS